jgi:hypothetical protein
MFEQAIFILKEDALGREGFTDEMLMQEALRLIRNSGTQKRLLSRSGPLWACGGAAVTAILWLMSTML